MIQTIHEIEDKFDIEVRDLGQALAMFIFSGSVSSNPCFMVRLYKNGQLRIVDMADCLMYGNPGNSDDVFVPPIPDSWKKKEEKVAQ